MREELTISLIYHMFNGRSHGKEILKLRKYYTFEFKKRLHETYLKVPRKNYRKCLASECKAKLALTLPSAARHSKNLNVLQVSAKLSSL